jgi:hypothetical protein
MFNDHTWNQLTELIKNLPRNSSRNFMLFCKTDRKLHLIKINKDSLSVATEDFPETFTEIPRGQVERLYNELSKAKKLSYNDIAVGLNSKLTGFMMSLLALIHNVSYDPDTRSIKFS